MCSSDLHLADQWLLPLGLAVWQSGRSQQFRAGPLSLHATTHLEILQAFLGVRADIQTETAGSTVRVGLHPG